MRSCGRSSGGEHVRRHLVASLFAAYPDFATAIDTESIATPDKLGVDIRDLNVLDDNIAAPSNAEAFSLAKHIDQLKTYSTIQTVLTLCRRCLFPTMSCWTQL